MTAADGWLLDEAGRRLLLRGINLGGSSKVPTDPPGATHLSAGFNDHRTVNFVGRPLPLDQAADHLNRIRDWGFTTIRLLVTWEAIEHAGPGIIDGAYLDYLSEIVRQAGAADLGVIVDLHQDTWSRFTGGDGAPGWTLEAAGIDCRRIEVTGAAITHQAHLLPYEAMIWPTNASKLAAATMFTLFFGGDDFAPGLTVDGQPIQELLRTRYLAVLRLLAERLRGRSNLLAFDPMNEPLPGYIGCRDLTALPGEPRIGALPSPLQGMALGDGHPQEVARFRFGSTGSRRAGTITLNQERVSLWRAPGGCPWRSQGVWDLGPDGSPRLLSPDYFARVAGRKVSFDRDYYQPFLRDCVTTIRSVAPDALILLEPAIGGGQTAPFDRPNEGIVSSPHWYDGTVLMLKRFNPWLGANAATKRPVFGPVLIRRSYRSQLRRLVETARRELDGAPTLIGEVGIPFDLAARRGRLGRERTRAMERSLRAMDDAIVSYLIWNYTPDNDDAHGDQWNGENLSIYAAHEGGRALDAVVRPAARAVAGTPLRMGFDLRTRRFELVFEHDPSIDAPTELFVPALHYPHGVVARLSDGHIDHDPSRQLLRYSHSAGRRVHRVELRPHSPT